MSAYEFKVEGMTCGHCIRSITHAVKVIDEKAQVVADIASQNVRVESSASAQDLAAGIEDAGYKVLSTKE